MNEAMRCKCPKPLKDGARCAKCGRTLPLKRRPRPPMLDFKARDVKPTEIGVDEYERMLDRAEKDSSRAE